MNNRRRRPEIPGRFILFVLASIAIVFLSLSYTTNFSGGYIRVIAETVFVPMQRGIGSITERISLGSEQTATLDELKAENARLKDEVDRLNAEISGITLRESELEDLRSLMALKNTYNQYETTGAYVIGKGSSNWFNTFTIDKGSKDGIKENMNVLAGEGLVGIVVSVGENHSVVRSIVDDTSNVSGMVSSTGDNLIVSGSIEEMTNGNMIEFSNLEDLEGNVKVGDTIVTSNISDKYVPGLLIGYIASIKDDANGLSKSGQLAPVADFKHINEVLVVMTVKQTGDK